MPTVISCPKGTNCAFPVLKKAQFVTALGITVKRNAISRKGFGGQDSHNVFLTPELLDAIKTSSLLIPEEKAYITLADGLQWLSNSK